MPQTLSEIRAMLEARGVRPVHRLGQNFLHDGNQLRKILAAADLHPGERVLEVGPGTGVLTEPMLEAGAHVTAVEFDETMCDILRERIGADRDGWRLIAGDALASKHALNPEIESALGGRDKPFKLVANLPYQIASPLLATLAIDWPGMTEAVITVQREVAERITAAPGSKIYGPLGVLLQAVCETKIVATLSPGCFWPQPQVGSAVVRLTRRDAPVTDDPARLSRHLHALFSKRRKQLGAILGRDHALPEGVESTQRPESLSVAQLCALSNRMDG